MADRPPTCLFQLIPLFAWSVRYNARRTGVGFICQKYRKRNCLRADLNYYELLQSGLLRNVLFRAPQEGRATVIFVGDTTESEGNSCCPLDALPLMVPGAISALAIALIVN